MTKSVCKNLASIGYHHRFPKELQNRDRDKFFYRLNETQVTNMLIFCPLRYPDGESYEVRKMAHKIVPGFCQDLVARMEPVIMELERKETVVVVGHQAVLRFNNISFSSPPLLVGASWVTFWRWMRNTCHG